MYSLDTYKLYECNSFSVAVGEDWFSVRRCGADWFRFPVVSALDTEDRRDADTEGRIKTVESDGPVTRIVWKTASALWRTKEYCLEISPDHFRYFLRVAGSGCPVELHYCCGADRSRPDGIEYEVSEYFLPMPRFSSETHLFSMAEEAELSAKLMAPPLYCLPYRRENADGWFGLGIAAKPGNFRFERFCAGVRSNRLQLTLPLAAGTNVDGAWETPALLGCFGSSEWEVLKAYSDWHYQNGCPRHTAAPARWWYGPFFCGWGEQAVLAARDGCTIYDAASQKLYEEMSGLLDALELHPTAIIIDDKWQKFYGEALPDGDKWPDLRKFTEDQHRRGRKVVLWFKCWDCEGLPAEECVRLNGKAIAADPTNPAYQERIRGTLHRLLSDGPGCFDCDGFKLDFTDCFPQERGMEWYDDTVGGIELLHRLIELIATAAKRIKPDALINCSACHPYFVSCIDQVRLHDYNADQRMIRRCMQFRRDLYRTVDSGLLIDTDFPSFGGHEDSMEYIRFAPELGVPDLYRLSDTDRCVFSEQDRQTLRLVWREYRRNIETTGKEG